MKFDEFGFDERLMDGVRSLAYESPTPIQERAIPAIMQGKDIIASAQTGTGKTAAFLLPLIHKILSHAPDNHIKALIIVPTRELAVQIDQQMEGLSYFTPVSSIAVYGGTDGTSFDQERQSLMQGADVVICTPGRMIAHLVMGYVSITQLQVLVLDEADRMLDMGFYSDIMKIVSFLPEQRQNLLFAATMPDKIRELARKVLKDPMDISIAISKPAEKILQVAYIVYDTKKIQLVKHLLKSQKLKSVLIFCSTKSSTHDLFRELKDGGLDAGEIHSNLDQESRERVMNAFKSHQLTILVATDIVSRGIDVEDIDLVINYDVPQDGEDYIHRIGRTARAAAEGIAITFITEKEQTRFAAIERLLGKEVYKAPLPPGLGDSPQYNPGKVFHQRGRKPKRKN